MLWPPEQEKSLVNCCEDYMNQLLARQATEESLKGNFEIRLVDKTDSTTATFKTVGKPLQFDLEPLDKTANRIDHKYAYGVNVTTVVFPKDSDPAS